jgi:putative ABC transport system permease protein
MNQARLVTKNLGRRKLRTILMLVAISIAFLLFGALESFMRGLNAGENAAAADRLVTVNKINFTVPLPISYVDRVSELKGVTHAASQSFFGGYYQDPKNFLFMMATDPAAWLSVYAKIKAGMPVAQQTAWINDRRGLAVGRVVADKFHWKLGDHVPISSSIFSRADGSHNWDFTVDAIIRAPDDPQRETMVLMQHKYFDETVTFGRDTTGMVVFTTANASLNDAIEKQIDTMFANSPAETITDTAAAFNKAFIAQLGNIALIITLVVSTAFAAILLIVGNTMVMAIRERTREIGVLKTLGFTGPMISTQVLAESLLLALFGALLGLGTAAALITSLKKPIEAFVPGVHMTAGIFLAGLGWAILLGIVTGAVPAWSALRLNIVTALGRR